MYIPIKSFSADVSIGKIYISIPKTQHNIFYRMMCVHTVHVTVYKATVC
jgi:hypothetical protein